MRTFKTLKIEIPNTKENHEKISYLLECNSPITVFTAYYMVNLDRWVNSDFENHFIFEAESENEFETIIETFVKLKIKFSVTQITFYK